MSRASSIVVLAEDQRHQNFALRYLYRLGFPRNCIRLYELPGGRQSGEQWVRTHYASATQYCRTRQATSALVVIIDADTETVARRARRLSDELATAQVPARDSREPIVHLIPKRHIETWLLCLNGESVNEHDDYKPRAQDSMIAPAAAALFDWSRAHATIPMHCVSSLATALPELARLNHIRE